MSTRLTLALAPLVASAWWLAPATPSAPASPPYFLTMFKDSGTSPGSATLSPAGPAAGQGLGFTGGSAAANGTCSLPTGGIVANYMSPRGPMIGSPFSCPQLATPTGGVGFPPLVDIQLDSIGPELPIARTFSLEQLDAGDHFDSDGFQGFNWHQSAQPELVYDFADPEQLPPGAQASYASGSMAAGDRIYLVAEADKYLEFERVADYSYYFRGVNGTVGVLEHHVLSDATDYDVVYDRLGNVMTFFGADAGSASKQFWKMEDPAGNVAYSGHETDIDLALSLGYGSDGAVDVQYDAEGRRYSFSYSLVSSTSFRLASVIAEEPDGSGGWDELTRVEYTYYTSNVTNNGLVGDLKTVKVTSNLSDSGVRLEERTHYRYYTDSNGNGHPHFLRMVVEPEGVRRYTENNPSVDVISAADSVLEEYALAEFEYYPETIPTTGPFIDQRNSMRLKKMTTTSGCSCGADGVHEFRYEQNPAYTDTSAYDTEWAYRTIVSTPSGLWRTFYLDEVKDRLSTVETIGDPATATEFWATLVERDADGFISAIHSPENVTGYTHGSTDPSATVAVAFTCSDTDGLVTTFERFDGSGGEAAYEHYIRAVWHQEGCGSSVTRYADVLYDVRAQTREFPDPTSPEAELSRVYVYAERPFESDSIDDVGAIPTSESDLTKSFVHYFVDSDSVVLTSILEVSPVPVSAKNGSGAISGQATFYRLDGTLELIQHSDGTWDYLVFDRGLLTELYEDVTSSTVPGASVPSGYTISSTGQERRTAWTFDSLGRPTFEETWDGRVAYTYYTKLGNGRQAVLRFPLVTPATSGGTPDYGQAPVGFDGPAQFEVVNLAGQVEERGTVTIAGGATAISQADLVDETETSPLEAFALGTSSGIGALGSWERTIHNSGGWLASEVQAYFDIPSSGYGSEGVNFDSTYYEYDATGNLIRIEEPSGTIRAFEYDERSLLVSESMGTDDSGSSNMVVIKEYEYDNGNDGGNGNLTEVTLHEDSTTSHVTAIQYDYRNRALLVESPESPHLFAKLDNLGRTVAIGEYSDVSSISITSNDPTTTTTNRVGLREASYDELGRVWRTKLHDVEQPSSGVSGGTSLSSLESLYWYDSMSRLRKTTGQSYAKYSYDSLGRMTRSYLLGGDNDSSYSDALDVSGDVVVTEGQKVYHSGSDFLSFDLTIDRYHDSGTSSPLGDLDSNADGDPTKVTVFNLAGRPSITAYTYDSLGRRDAETLIGAPSSDFTWNALSQANHGLAFTQVVNYSERGHVESIADHMERVKLREVDDLGRTTAVYNNYVDGVLDAIDLANDPGSAGGTDHWDDDQKVSYTYVDGLLTEIKAHDPSTDTNDPDQVTTYTYGSVTSGSGPISDVATGHYLAEIAYPDSASSTDVVTLAYNRFGQVTWQKDQAGNVIERDIDGLGRTTALRATTIATGFDARVKRIERGYDERGALALVTQYGAATGGSILDQVAIDRFGHGGISSFDQDWDSAVGGGGSLATRGVTYDYALSTGGRKSYRKTKQTLPSGREFSFTYAAGIDDDLSRVSTLMDGRRRVTSYKYLGASRVVGTNYGVPDIHSNLFGSTSGSYPGLDEYGRVVSFQWTKNHSLGTTNFYDVSLTLDDNSNPTVILDNVADDWDVSATHDGLDRITSFEEGDWDSMSDSMSTLRTRQSWLYDQIGNWVAFEFDVEGGGTFPDVGDTNERRHSNDVNEIEGRDLDSDETDDETFAYDPVGNLISTGNRTYAYDVWGRQTHVYLGGTGATTLIPFAEYEYNGLGYRTRELTDLDDSGELDGGDNWLSHVYDQDWRIVATYWGGDDPEDPKAEFLFHRAGFDGNGGSSYINSAVVRFRDANGSGWNSASDGVLEEEHYICSNQRGDTVAVVDDSGETVEWARYSAYGVPFGLPVGDCDFNGVLNAADSAIVNSHAANSTYEVAADLNLDGVVDSTDFSLVLAAVFSGGHTGGYGRLSSFGHSFGFAGMRYDVDGTYIARNRLLVPGLGQWARRDPLGYHDSMDLYGYVAQRTLAVVDPYGLKIEWPSEWPWTTFKKKWDAKTFKGRDELGREFSEGFSRLMGADQIMVDKAQDFWRDLENSPPPIKNPFSVVKDAWDRGGALEKGLMVTGLAGTAVCLALPFGESAAVVAFRLSGERGVYAIGRAYYFFERFRSIPVVLGRHPLYVNHARLFGYRYFSVSTKIEAALGHKFWQFNRAYLDAVLPSGAPIQIVIGNKGVGAGGLFKELSYLASKGWPFF